MSYHSRIPFGLLRKWYRAFRRAFFSRPRRAGPYVRVVPTGEMCMLGELPIGRENVGRLRRELGVSSYAPNWEFSFYKRGEDLNLARVVYWSDHDFVDDEGEPIVWWQTHVRGWVEPGGVVELTAHWEPEPTEADAAHIEGVGFDRERGMNHLKAALAEAGVEYEEFYLSKEEDDK